MRRGCITSICLPLDLIEMLQWLHSRLRSFLFGLDIKAIADMHGFASDTDKSERERETGQEFGLDIN